jgi:hypothetical protein
MMPSTFGGFSQDDVRKYLEEQKVKQLADEKKRLEEEVRSKAEAERKRLEQERLNAEADKRVLDDLAHGDVYLPEFKPLDYDNSEFFDTEGAFDDCLADLAVKKARICSSEEFFGKRIRDAHTNRGFQSGNICDRNNWTSECFYYFPNGKIYVALAPRNLILQHPKEATDCHRQKKQFYVDQFALIKSPRGLEYLARDDPVEARKTGVLCLRNDGEDINALKFHKHSLGLFLGGENAKAYGKLCHSEDASELGYDVIDEVKDKRPFALPLRFFQVDSIMPAFVANEISLSAEDLVKVLGVSPVYKGGAQ